MLTPFTLSLEGHSSRSRLPPASKHHPSARAPHAPCPTRVSRHRLTGDLASTLPPVTSHESPLTNSFRIRTYEKHAPNPFGINTYRTQDLKPFRIRTYKKTVVVGRLLLTRHSTKGVCPERPSEAKDLSCCPVTEGSGPVGKDFYPGPSNDPASFIPMPFLSATYKGFGGARQI